jgi:anaphase-promoting complex subunit 8
MLSNILFVQDNRVELSRLAHRACTVDAYRPETCCVVGAAQLVAQPPGPLYPTNFNHSPARRLSLFCLFFFHLGNFYSIKGQHAQAVQHFERALRLDPHLVTACTLLGHEFIELKNPPAALAAYRRAVDTDPRDYRAWYGLGQTYELLGMPLYALYYYRRAQTLRPYDARMWGALAATHKVCGEKIS